jgi:hypothetical protein
VDYLRRLASVNRKAPKQVVPIAGDETRYPRKVTQRVNGSQGRRIGVRGGYFRSKKVLEILKFDSVA